MKYSNIYRNPKPLQVAPLVGAWIEISGDSVDGGTFTVAPLVGAWIEIQSRITRGLYQYVAPLVGAWIEILNE